MRILEVTLVALALCHAACNSKDEPRAAAKPVASAPVPAPPVDHLAESELVEGKLKAFALTLPRNVSIRYAFPDDVLVEGDVAPEPLANYVRARVRDGTITVGATGTTFERVKVPAEPTRELRIRVTQGRGSRTAMDVRDVTPPVVPDPGNDVDRWKQAGLQPNGRPIDPKQLR